MLLHGDCLEKMRELKGETIDLVYLDPPFFTQKKQILKKRNKKEYSFEDKWCTINDYREYIQERIRECYRLLKRTGSIFLHCDKSACHHCRLALDNVFGPSNFQSEIIWTYKRWSNSKKGLMNSHQVIFFYSKSKDFKFHAMYNGYSATTNIDQIFQKRMRDQDNKTIYKKDKDGDYELIDKKKGVPLSDVWEIPYLNPKARERIGFPTQKPIILLEQIIKMTTDEGDIVLDPFAGSGTTLVAAKIFKRKYIGIDISKDAIDLACKRLEDQIKTESLLLQKGKEAYNKQDDKIVGMLNILGAIPVQRNKGIDGFLKVNGSVKPIPIRIQRGYETIDIAKNMLIKACEKNRYKTKILIKTNNLKENWLFTLENDFRDKDLLIIDNFSDLVQKELYSIQVTK